MYDLFCAPHERFGMAMRVVAGDETEPTVSWTDLTVEFPGGGSEGGE
jgi:hypothetical protein